MNEWSIASKASKDHLRLELWYPSSPDVTTEKCGAESWWGNTPGGQNRINLDDKNADGAITISVGISSEIPAEVKKNADQAYSIEAKDNSVCITVITLKSYSSTFG